MAQLKDTVVSGSLRATDSLLTTTLQTQILKLPTASNGTTYGPGTSGHIIFSNGSSAYWGATTGITALGTVTTGTWNATKINPNKGGTGVDSYAKGDILYAGAAITNTATTALSKLALGTAGYTLQATANGPAWAQTVAVANGGTGKTSWTQWGVLYASASTTLANTGAGTAGYLLQSNASSAPSWIQATNANTASTIVKRDASGNFSAGTITAALSGNATSSTSAKYLMNRGGDTVTIVDDTWAHGHTHSGYTNRATVWHQRWKQSGITYTPSGGSATTLTDSGDMVLWLSSANDANTLQLNMAIDGDFKTINSIYAGNHVYIAVPASRTLAASSATDDVGRGIYFRDNSSSPASIVAVNAYINKNTANHRIQLTVWNDAATAGFKAFNFVAPSTVNSAVTNKNGYIAWDNGYINNSIFPYINGDKDIGNSTYAWRNLYLGGVDGAGIYYVNGTTTTQMIRFLAGDGGGHGIQIGGGGAALFGSGESAGTVRTGLNLGGATEQVYITSDNQITFFTNQQDGYNSAAKVTIDKAKIWAGVDGDTTYEAQVGVQAGSGRLYLASQAATGGTRGLYANAHGSATTGRFVVSIDTNNNAAFNGMVWGNTYVRSSLTKGTNPSANSYPLATWLYQTGSGTAVKDRLAGLQGSVMTDGTTKMGMYAYKNEANGEGAGVLEVSCTSSGSTKATCNGVIISSGGGEHYCMAENTTTGLKIYLDSGSGANHGLYSNGYNTGTTTSTFQSSGLFIVYRNSSNQVVINRTHAIVEQQSVSYIAGAKGDTAGLLAKKTEGATAWYPAVCIQTKAAGSWQIGTYTSESLEFVYAAKADITNQTNDNAKHWYLTADSYGTILTTRNYSSYALPLSGGTMTGDLKGSKTNIIGSTAIANHWYKLYLGGTTADSSALNSATPLIEFSNTDRSQYAQILYTDYNSQGGSDSFHFVSNQTDLRIYAPKIHGAVWNDYAECRISNINQPGRVVTETNDGIMILNTERLAPACRIISDTYGMLIGETKQAKTPIAVSGRVLAYPYRDRNEYPLGAAVCAAPNGTVDIMTREEIMMYPERIIGTVSEIPKYKIWSAGYEGKIPIEVNGRIWIYVR